MKTTPHQRLVMVGDRDGLKELLRRRLVECGWRDQVKLICKELIKEQGQDVTYDKLLSMVTSKARTLVPDSVKKELLQKIKNQLIAQEEKLKM
ncbi:transcription and mRNA export factor ENY2 [Ceratina calcarata]|uniref:Enhancer of yellow 2 transcription factor n=1 Tax=Ceratina calcarata TaxID=156304 RepID=A0AAJ7N3W0_9HYME|nr:transcription and mRNA export factor ENY2 [Ceratina calcarata]